MARNAPPTPPTAAASRILLLPAFRKCPKIDLKLYVSGENRLGIFLSPGSSPPAALPLQPVPKQHQTIISTHEKAIVEYKGKSKKIKKKLNEINSKKSDF